MPKYYHPNTGNIPNKELFCSMNHECERTHVTKEELYQMTEDKIDEDIKFITSKSERISLRKLKIEKELLIIDIINCFEKLIMKLSSEEHSYSYIKIVADTAKDIVEDIEDRSCCEVSILSDIGSYINDNNRNKNLKRNKDYMDKVYNFLINVDEMDEFLVPLNMRFMSLTKNVLN